MALPPLSYQRLVNNQSGAIYGRLFERRERSAPVLKRPAAHLAVIAGPRGAGKSTLIRWLASPLGTTPFNGFLPPQIGQWPAVEAEGDNGWLTSFRDGSSPRLLLHYDLVRLVEFSPNDQALDALCLARRLSVVTIKPSIDRLAIQMSHRQSALFQRVSGQVLTHRPHDAVARQIAAKIEWDRRRVLASYATPGWLTEIYRVWDELVAAAGKSGAKLRQIEIEPASEPASTPSWRVKPAIG